jgi:uncharacterized membrane protein YjjP (DUF1212 family)
MHRKIRLFQLKGRLKEIAAEPDEYPNPVIMLITFASWK